MFYYYISGTGALQKTFQLCILTVYSDGLLNDFIDLRDKCFGCRHFGLVLCRNANTQNWILLSSNVSVEEEILNLNPTRYLEEDHSIGKTISQSRSSHPEENSSLTENLKSDIYHHDDVNDQFTDH